MIASKHVKSMVLAFFMCVFSTSCGGGGGGGGGLAAPTDVIAIPGNGQIIIAWTPVASATSYNIYWSATPNVTLNNGTKITDAANPYTQTGLTNGTTYYYVVTAVNSDGESGTSTQASGMPEDTSHAVVLDETFGADGIVITPVGSSDDEANGIAIQGDGKIVMAGYSDNGSNDDIAVVRYNTDGTLDTTFDGDGIVTTPIGSSDDKAYGIAIQGDGKIVVAGYSDNGSDDDIAVVRYNADGSLDTTFDGDGIVTTPIGPSNDGAIGIAIQGDGKIVVTGYSGPNRFLTVVRYHVDGSLDTTFDGDGIVTTSMLTTNPSIAIRADGKIIVLGSTLGATSVNIYLARYNTDGTLDTTFGSDGIALTPTGGIDGAAQGIAIQGDGKIVVGGTFAVSKDEIFNVLARYTVDGSLDTSFDSDGMVIGPDGYFTSDIALQPDGKIVLGGFSAPSKDFFLVRYQ